MDSLYGDAGNDTYDVDSSGDVVHENAGGGTDTVFAAAHYTLSANVENLTLKTGIAWDATGNGMDNVLTGNGVGNQLFGLDGNDTLIGGGGMDSLYGGAGNDTYDVDSSGDVVHENSGQGLDTVFASATYTLGANVENLTLTGTGGISGSGNSLDNVLTGNSGANTLSGAQGADTLTGAGGADTLTGGAGSDRFLFKQLDGSVDAVTDFTAGAAGDVLDVRDLLTGYTQGSSNPSTFVRLTVNGGATTVSINSDGAGSDFVDIALLQGVSGLTVSDMLTNGNLIVA